MPRQNARLSIRLLGRLEVRRGGHRVVLPPSRQIRALLAFLVLTGQPARRERLCDIFFETPADPKAALRWALTKLRPLVNDPENERLLADRTHVAFAADDVDVDVFVFSQFAGEKPEETGTERLEEAMRLYRGDLLEDIELPECHRFEAWLTGERECRRALQDQILSQLTRRLRKRPEGALYWASQRLQSNPYSEAAHADIIDLLVHLGRPDEALRQYRRCCRMLAEEMNAKPSASLRRACAKSFGKLKLH